MNAYIPVILILAIGLVIGTVMSFMSHYLGPRKPTEVKQENFECGVPQVTARDRMSVKFYLTAILFILFDIETIFLYLWAKTFSSLAWFGVMEVLIFVLILVVGYIYVLKRGALEWN